MRLHGPLSEAAQRLQMDVSRPCPHVFIELSHQPTLNRACLNVPQQTDAAIVKQDAADALRVSEVSGRNAFDSQMRDILPEMIRV